ncbi:MAG: Bax inhibitor-1/YccA family protein [Aquabacterium sp.]
MTTATPQQKISPLLSPGNPALRASAFLHPASPAPHMTFSDALHRSAVMLAITVATAGLVWHQASSPGDHTLLLIWLAGGGFGAALVLMLMAGFVKPTLPYTAPLFAVAYGLTVGVMTVLAEKLYPGVAIQAAGLTFCLMACILVSFRRARPEVIARWRRTLRHALAAVALMYLIALPLTWAGLPLRLFHEGRPMDMLLILGALLLAAYKIQLDLDFIEAHARGHVPKYMAWYCAIGLLVTLVWCHASAMLWLLQFKRRS